MQRFVWIIVLLLSFIKLSWQEIYAIHDISEYSVKVKGNDEYPDYINFEFVSNGKTFVFWLQRKVGIIGKGSRVITHRNNESEEHKNLSGRPYVGKRLLILSEKENSKGSRLLEDIDDPIARFYAHKMYKNRN